METLHYFGTPQQKRAWLDPLLDGEIRSAFVMTEPGVFWTSWKMDEFKIFLITSWIFRRCGVE